jgi:hypothetical protein
MAKSVSTQGVAEQTFATLKAKHRQLRSDFPENLSLRVHRSLSWLNRAEIASEDLDAAFIFYWISFNAAYADDRNDFGESTTRSHFSEYFEKVVSLDTDHRVYDAIWRRFSQSIRTLLSNKFVFQPFWNHQNQVTGHEEWEKRFNASQKIIRSALQRRDTRIILETLFDRLYVLRNQLIHGGATWNSSVNRDQVRDGRNILGFLIPIFLNLMMDNPELDWGAPYYPIVE